jgi:hypothetical protein
MTAPGLQEPAKKALATLDREWDGLAAHRDYPMIGLDNNPAGRMIRGPVVTRKNTGGSRNGDTARNAAVIWTVTATAQMAGLNLLTWLTAYPDECGTIEMAKIPVLPTGNQEYNADGPQGRSVTCRGHPPESRARAGVVRSRGQIPG